MPCNSDYMEPSGQELESKRVCKNIIYINKMISKETPKWIKEAANDYYGNVNRIDEATKILCETCRSLTKKEEDKYIYDGRNPKARKLAGWWDRHQEWDKRRVKEEKDTRKKIHLKERALKKLTKSEIEVLGLD